MQSGTTGINITRVYNPIKQAQDHDPQGHFVKRWLPRMRQVPHEWLFEPWLNPLAEIESAEADREVMRPIVDTQAATRLAKQRLHERRRDPEVKAGKMAVVEKHASRQNSNRKRKTSSEAVQSQKQMGFDF